MDNQLELTEDGSHTVRSGQFGIQYHSRHGAVQESEHVFIAAGLASYLRQHEVEEVNILELGLGTGLNVLLSMREAAQQTNIQFNYRAVELYPLEKEIIQGLNYTQALGLPDHWLAEIHSCPWEKETALSPNFNLHKQAGDWLKLAGAGRPADVVFYDAFAPNAQEELWSEKAFALLATAMQTNGIWVSYCAKGAVKRALRANGFEVHALPGPPGKREMTQAFLSR
ncbi:MAG: tRNA (5-methylaminomethyl-2-thiouridine)(34)-methyltransferase MnmD [Bacteroidota bacterium]